MSDSPAITWAGVVLDAPDPRELAGFYEQLLGWTRVCDDPDWVQLRAPGGGRPSLSFQPEPRFQPPRWPAEPDTQQMQSHLDLLTDDLAGAGARARALGATLADHQPQPGVRVYLDPAGHPFCFFIDGA